MACRKLTFSLPDSFVQDLDYLAKRLNITRSALLTQLAASPTSDLRHLVEDVPDNPTKSDLIHAKGRSIELVEERVASAKRVGHDLFSE